MLFQDIEVLDYSLAGGHPCYHFSFIFRENKNCLYSLMVSIISPYYIIRSLNLKTLEKKYSFTDFEEEIFLNDLSELMKNLISD